MEKKRIEQVVIPAFTLPLSDSDKVEMALNDWRRGFVLKKGLSKGENFEIYQRHRVFLSGKG